jgi:hypothetical protein
MKYILLIMNNQEYLDSLPAEQREAIGSDVDTIMAELTERGEFVGGQALAHPSMAKTIRPVEGLPVASDGPYAEAKEQLAGYLIVDVDSEERAVEIASRWPDARYGAMEVRAIMDTAGTEM